MELQIDRTNKLQCQKCGQLCAKHCSVIAHVKRRHGVESKAYYDEFFKKDDEGICKYCGKPVPYRDLQNGYREFCDRTCFWRYTTQSDAVKAKREQTCLTKYGTKQYMATKDFKEKSAVTNEKLYNSKNVFSSPEVIAKIKATKLANGTLHNEQQAAEKLKQVFEKYKELLKDSVEVLSYSNDLFTCKCKTCNKIFTTHYQNIYNRHIGNRILCTYCNPISQGTSSAEQEILQYIKSLVEDKQRTVINRCRSILPDLELDIYIPDYNLAIEYDGLYWHSEEYKIDTYHVNKTNLCEAKNIQLIHIFEDEWRDKQDIVKSRLSGLLNMNTVIYARDCECREVSSQDAMKFLNENHLQGAIGSMYRYGLYYNDKLVSLMTFGKSRFNETEFELLRFCNVLWTHIIGGASKLFTHFLRDHQEINEIISYADRRWSRGQVYEKLGFTKDSISKPSYYYVIDNCRENRIHYQKHILVEQGYDSTKSEHDIMLERGIYRIYDCGTLKYRYVRK